MKIRLFSPIAFVLFKISSKIDKMLNDLINFEPVKLPENYTSVWNKKENNGK